MAGLHDAEGRRVALWLDDVEDISIASFDFSPAEDDDLTDQQKLKYTKRGFTIRPDEDGTVYVITWREWKQVVRQDKTIDDCTPVPLYCLGGMWEAVPLIKVFSGSDQEYTSVPSNINIGIIL
jgi:hypothetical protein